MHSAPGLGSCLAPGTGPYGLAGARPSHLSANVQSTGVQPSQVWFPLGITASPGPSTNSGQAGGGSVGRPGHSPSEGWAIRPQHDRTAWPRGRSHCLGWRPAHCRAVRKSDTDPCDSGRCHRPGTSAGTHLLPPPCTHRVRLVGHSMAKTPRDLVFKEGACSRLQGQHKGQECGQSCPLPPPLWFS